MKMYWNYLKYVIKHKWYVFRICINKGMFIHAFTHDLSKFLPSEFIPYAKNFYGDVKDESVKYDFEVAVLKHYHRNKHHFVYWIGTNGKVYDMPEKYVRQLVADWWAMSWASLRTKHKKISMYDDRVLDDLKKFFNKVDKSNFSEKTLFYLNNSLRGIL